MLKRPACIFMLVSLVEVAKQHPKLYLWPTIPVFSQGIQRHNALNIHSSCCFYRSLTQWSWQRKTEPPKSLGRGRHCVWQTDGSIEMLWMSQLGGDDFDSSSSGTVCAWQTCQASGLSKWIPEAGALDLTGSFSFWIFHFRRSVFSLCFWFSFKQISHDPSPQLLSNRRSSDSLSPPNAKLSDQWVFPQCFYHRKCGVNFSGNSQVNCCTWIA